MEAKWGGSKRRSLALQLPPRFVIGSGVVEGYGAEIDAKAGFEPCTVADLRGGLGRTDQACNQGRDQIADRRGQEGREEAGRAERTAGQEEVLFGAVATPAPLAVRAIGSYAKGCLSGGVSLPINGPDWQVMRLSRNRNWGHPRLLDYLERLASDARGLDGWPGLLVGDMAQPRGGPMITGHTSHQIGLDADIWLTPMPDIVLTPQEREDITATSMLKGPLHRRSEHLDAAAHEADQAGRIVSAGRAHLRAPGDQEGALRAGRQEPRLAQQGASLVEPLLPLPCAPHLSARGGGLRQPEAGGERGRLRQRTRGVVQDAAQGRAMAVSAARAARCQASAEKASDGPQRSPTECTAVLNSGGGGPVVAADGTVPAALKVEAGKGARRSPNTEARSCGLRGAQSRVREEGEVEARGES